MKKLFFLCTFCLAALLVLGQGNSKGHGKGHNKEKEMTGKGSGNHDGIIWAGTVREKDPFGKPSKNIPKKVEEAFSSQFAIADNTRWTKYRGDWAGTFSNPVYTTTVVYHANGDLKDARTVATESDLPASVRNSVDKQKPSSSVMHIVKVELPSKKEIYRVQLMSNGASNYKFYDQEGNELTYDY